MRKRAIKRGLIVAAVAFAFSGAGNGAEKPAITDELVSMGEGVYARECASCHGVEGDGEGPGAHYLNPKPRDFSLAVYKLRSTPNGEVPTEHDLFKTITNGVRMMPSFKSLSEKERWALVEVIRRFGGIEEENPEAIVVPAQPEMTQASIDNGKVVYDRLDCASCHGVSGVGDGPSSLSLENDAEERVFAADLTSGKYKGGSLPTDLYTRIWTGLDGSPMPSYSEEASPEEVWDLVHYLQTLVTQN